MSDFTLVLLAAGNSNRFSLPVKKQWLRIGNDPLWLFVAKRFEKMNLFNKIIITASKEESSFMEHYSPYTIVTGGESRQASLKNALSEVDSEYVLVSDIARSCVSLPIIKRLIDACEEYDVTVPYLKADDTILYKNETIERDEVKRIQTPQISKTETLREALRQEELFTDESSAIVSYGGKRGFVQGEESAHKLTHAKDRVLLPCLKSASTNMFTGNGFDVHQFEDGKPMVLGGVPIDSPFGFKAHSDGDVAIHSLIDSLLGATGLGDIGTLFPDSDDAYKDADSKELLLQTVTTLHHLGFEIINVDITIMAQAPRLESYKQAMRATLAMLLRVEPMHVNIKATTTEKLGFVGRKEGVAVLSSANVKFFDWTK